MSQADTKHMARALLLAQGQRGRTGKNPAVGCVITGADGQVLSEAATGDGGTLHAEQLALDFLGGKAPGATAYVTLEPCRARSTDGQSCSERLLSAGIARLVCAIQDVHPNGAGGLERLRTANIAVETGLLADEAEILYADFFAANRA
ncbi:MAG: riboflavin biosynthesis protein RibD [Pseudomonadota bacterium]